MSFQSYIGPYIASIKFKFITQFIFHANITNWFTPPLHPKKKHLHKTRKTLIKTKKKSLFPPQINKNKSLLHKLIKKDELN